MNKFKFVNKNDKYRILLTEVLPYETPIWFTNEFFHLRAKDEEFFQLPDIFTKSKEAKIPYSYNIKRDYSGERQLSIIHPLIQLKIVDFYHKYKDLIIYYCNKEDTSLRKPIKIASRFLSETNLDSNDSIGVEEDTQERKYCSSYYIYEKFGFIYKFYESYHFHRLERKYPFLLKLDVSRCFYNIYTHSIAWALKSKNFVKENLHKKKGSFGDDFDTLMQDANYKETNGILVGPEISRLFAEIIFQKIDINIIKYLEEYNLFYKKDFEIKRYVDDIFIFFKKEANKDTIVEKTEKALEEYKLYINEQKKEFSRRPFLSDLSICKKEMLSIVKNHYKKRFKSIYSLNEKGAISTCKVLKNIGHFKTDQISNKFIVDIKILIKKYQVKYRSITGYLLSLIKNNIYEFISLIDKDKSVNESIKTWLLIDIEVMFFIYSMDFRVRPTIILARVIQKILSLINDSNIEAELLIKKKIFDGANAVLKYHESDTKSANIEVLNLILVISNLGEDFNIEEKRLMKIFIKDDKKISYFEWVSLMLVAQVKVIYSSLRNKLINIAFDYLKDDSSSLADTEKYLFSLDFMSCPYIDKELKKELLDCLVNNEKMSPLKEEKRNQYINFINHNYWFVDWNDKEWLSKRLEKKEYTFPYN